MIDFDIKDIFPRFILADKNGYALAKAIEKGLRMMLAAMDAGVRNITDIESMTEARLDEMAWEYNVTWYDYAGSTGMKRAQIRDAYAFYMKQGTPAAISGAIQAVYETGEVREWFQYGGEPYHFKILTENHEAVSENRDKFLRLVGEAKNLRSVFDDVEYVVYTKPAAIHAAAKATGADGRIYAEAT